MGNMRWSGSVVSGACTLCCVLLVTSVALVHISSERMVDDAISIAVATKENLTGQRTMFKGVTSRMQNITRILPHLACYHDTHLT